ncbi:MAG: hypothetical protein ACKO6N_06715 [Myxococcota bacterium]
MSTNSTPSNLTPHNLAHDPSTDASSLPPTNPQPYDRHGKQVLRIIAAPRIVETEHEHLPILRSDVLLREGPPLPPEAGILTSLFQDRLTLVELFRSRPRQKELWHARCKGLLALDRLPTPLPDTFPLPLLQLLIMVGRPHKALKRAFSSLPCKEVEPGLTRYYDVYELVCIDLLRLALRPETAWLHILGTSPWMMDAFHLVLAQGSETDLLWINALLMEGEKMPALQAALIAPELMAERQYVAKHWELAYTEMLAKTRGILEGKREGILEGKREGILEGKREGKREGILEGKQEGKREGILEGKQEGQTEGKLLGERESIRLVLLSRFGVVPDSLSTSLEHITQPEALHQLIRHAATGSLEEVNSLAQTLVLRNPPA